MTPEQLSLDDIEGAVRRTDPASSRAAAQRVKVGTQRATILVWLRSAEYVTQDRVVVTADDLFRKYPRIARGTWSTRLAAMADCGLLTKHDPADGERVLRFSLTADGRAAAGELAREAA